MGIQDRDYYRKNPGNRFGGLVAGQSAAIALIWVYSAIFVLQVFTRNQLVGGVPQPASPVTDALIFDADAILHGEVWRLISGFFVHSPRGLLSMLCNMLTLWWAGKEICSIYGDREFFACFLSVGFISSCAALVCCLLTGDKSICFLSTAPIAGVLTLFALHYPKQIVYLMFVLPVPVWVCVLLLIGKDFMIVYDGFHLADAVADLTAVGLAVGYYRLHWRVMPIMQLFNVFSKARRQPKLRVYRDRTPKRPERIESLTEQEPAPRKVNDEQLEAQLDHVLDKVQKHGQSSLNEEERQLLFRASEIYKRRRDRGAN